MGAKRRNLLSPEEQERADFFDSFDPPDGGAEPDEPERIEDRVDSIEQLNLEKELLDRYYEARELILNNKNSSLGQKSSAMARITVILKEITEMQTKLYTMERVKTMESVLIQVLIDFPDTKAAFLEKYKQALEDAA